MNTITQLQLEISTQQEIAAKREIAAEKRTIAAEQRTIAAEQRVVELTHEVCIINFCFRIIFDKYFSNI